MLHTVRQVVRYTALSIGFILFFFVTIHAAQTANDRKAVEGKHLLPAAQVATIGMQGSILVPGSAAVTAMSTVSQSHSSEPKVTQPSSTHQSQNSVAVAHVDELSGDSNSNKADTQPKQTHEDN